MRIRSTINDWLSIILKIIAIFAIITVVTFIFISIWANISEPDNLSGLPDFPDISKAHYLVYFQATGNILLTDKYDHPKDNIYNLYGYWEIRDNKYRYVDEVLSLDEYYFGDIEITHRKL